MTKTKKVEINVLDYVLVLAQHSRMILYTSAAVTILTYMYFFSATNIYRAKARLLPPQQNLTMTAQLMESLGGGISPGRGGSGGIIGGGAAALLGLKSSGDIFVSMMTGDTILDRMIERFNLKELNKLKYLEDARKALKADSRINLGEKDGIINVEVTNKDPQLATAMANAYPEELDTLLQKLALYEAKSRLAFFEKERDVALLNLTKAEETLRTFSEENGVVQIEAQTRTMLEYIARLRATIDTQEVQIQVLRQQATPSNYDVVRLESEIKGLKEKLRAAESQWDQACIGEVCLPTSKTPGLGLGYTRLFRDVKFQEGLYQLFTRMVEVARLDMAKNVAVVQMVDRATKPERRFNKRVFPALIAGIATFFFMIIVAFVRQFWLEKKEEGLPHFDLIAENLGFRSLGLMLNKISFYFKRNKNIGNKY